jgi:hypothetical protein
MRRACGAQRGRQPCPGRLLVASTVVPTKVVLEIRGLVIVSAALTFSRWDYSGSAATAIGAGGDGRLDT